MSAEEIFLPLIPISGIVGGMLLAYAGMLTAQRRREMIHTERMRALELGQEMPEFPIEDRGDPYGNLKVAVLLFALAIGLGLAGLLTGQGGDPDALAGVAVLGCIGGGFLVLHLYIPKAADRRRAAKANGQSPLE